MKQLIAAGSWLALATFAACVPWRLPSDVALAPMMLPAAIAVHFAARRPYLLADWALALAGLAVDVSTQSPLGYWPLVYLTAYAFGFLASGLVAPRPGSHVAIAISGIIMAGLTAALLRDLYVWHAIGIRPFAGAAGAAALVFLGVAIITAGIRAGDGARDGV